VSRQQVALALDHGRNKRYYRIMNFAPHKQKQSVFIQEMAAYLVSITNFKQGKPKRFK
jgi:hypothetical protein